MKLSLAPPKYVEGTIVPALTEGAADRARVAEPIIAETACVLSSDRDEVMTAVRRNMKFYLAMPVYRALFECIELIDSAGVQTRTGPNEGSMQ